MPKKSDKDKSATSETVTKVRFLPTMGEVPTFYVNNANIRASVWDVVVELGQVRGTEGASLLVEPTNRVIMSWPHAKVFASILSNVVKNYEQQFGEIKLPPNVTIKQRTVIPPNEKPN